MPAFQPVSKLQSVVRDIAIVLPDTVPYTQVTSAIERAATNGLLRGHVLFDLYRPKPQKDGVPVSGGLALGEKSLAIRLTLHSDEMTLTDEQIESAVQAVLQQLAADTGARLRV